MTEKPRVERGFLVASPVGMTARTVFSLLIVASSVAAQQQPDRSNYEMVLVPISLNRFSVSGANGSDWASELWVRNSSDHNVQVFDGASICVFPNSCIALIPPIPVIPANTTTPMPGPLNPISPNPSLFIYVGKVDSANISFSSRI